MARSRRRKTYWLGFSGDLTIDDTSGGEGSLTIFSDATLMERDPAPTLVRLVGKIIVSAPRQGGATPTSTAVTPAVEYGLGLMCQEAVSTQYTDPLDELGDERWIWTDFGGIHAPAQGQVVFDGSAPSTEFWYTPHFVAPYPREHPINARAMRKIEDPCNLVLHVHSITPFGNDDFADLQISVHVRALFKAS